MSGLEPAYADRDLTLYRIPNPREVAQASSTGRAIALAAHALWAAQLLLGILAALALAGPARRFGYRQRR